MRILEIKSPVEVSGEISAQAYKRLMEKLRKLNKKQLIECFDHYFCHVIDTKHVDEFLRILQDFENCSRLGEYDPVASNRTEIQIAASAEETSFIPPTEKVEDLSTVEIFTEAFPDTLTEDDLEVSKDFLDIMFDQTYFDSHLYPEARKPVAQKLISFANKNGLPVQEHWNYYA